MYEGLDGGGGGGGGVWNSLISKNLAHYSFFKIFAYSLKIIRYSLKSWQIFASFCMIQWRKSCLKQIFFFAWQKCEGKL